MQTREDYIYRQQWAGKLLFRWPGVGRWGFVFLTKVALAWQGYLDFELAANLAIIGVLVVPLRYSTLNGLRHISVAVLLAGLTYYESSLPPFTSVLDNLKQMAQFSFGYWLEIIGRYVTMTMISWLVIAWVVYLYIANLIRVTPVTIAVVVVYGLWGGSAEPELSVATTTTDSVTTNESIDANQQLNNFYQSQDVTRQLSSSIERSSFSSSNTDILLLNICSLSWQDLAFSGLLEHPVLQDADMILTQYNSVSSYSGPAALRVLQASCGQKPHGELFSPARQCLLAEQLESLNLSPQLFMNHNGEFDDFASLITKNGGLKYEPADRTDTPASMLSFDGSVIYDDFTVIDDWLSDTRTSSAFGFYNSISLHDGNRLLGSQLQSFDSYAQRSKRLLDDIAKVMQKIEQQQRNLLLLIVPEHGAGTVSDGMQLRGVREFPTPALTHVPVLMKWFGSNQYQGETIKVDHVTNQLALSELIYSTLAQRPYADDGQYDPEAVAKQLSEVDWVAENKAVKVIHHNSQWLLKLGTENWVPFTPDAKADTN